MSNKDKGWDYLNSDVVNNILSSDDDDGSRSYDNSDGSGSYSGADGSWGYKNSDGSGSYFGADGSWGYRNSNGSCSYYGNDGSWGYKNSDGSGSYYGSDNSSTYYDADHDYDDFSSESEEGESDLGSSLVDLALGLGAAAFAKVTDEARKQALIEEEKRLEQERIAEEKRHVRQEKRRIERKIRNKRLKALFFNKKNIQIDFSTSDLIGEDYKKVIIVLKEAGFNNYKVIPIKDIYVGSNKYVGEVEQVVINGQSWISEGTMVPYDAEIIITYHVKKEITFPYSYRQMAKRNFEELTQELVNIGFTEVYTFPINDLKTGWIKKYGSVHLVTVEGYGTIKRGLVLEYDRKITIQYHSFKKY